MSKTRSSDALFQDLETWVLQFPQVTRAPHKLGGVEFRVHGRGFMHSHGSSVLDIRLSKNDQALALGERRAQRHRADVHHHEGWVSYRIEDEEDVEDVKDLVQLAYDNARKESLLSTSQESKL